MSPSWSEIPSDFLYSILSKFSIPDLFRSAAVCSSWCAVVDMVRCRPDDQHPQIPWLVPDDQILINGETIDRNTYDFFSLSEGREYDIPSYAPRILKKVVGSSHGWFITTNGVSVRLLNPITGEQIDLPSVPSSYDQHLAAMEMKAALSSDPSRCGNYKVVFLFICRSRQKCFLFYVRAGGEKWTMIPGGLARYYYEDIVFYNDDKLYAVSESKIDDKVIVAAYDFTPTKMQVVAMTYVNVRDYTFDMHLVCTPSGDLLIARTVIIDGLSGHPDKKMKVWKVDTKKGAIIEMNDLGNYALFMGTAASSLCLDTCLLPDLKSNSIYISNYLGDVVYNMKDESFTSLNLPPVSSPELMRPVLVWFTPSAAF